METQTPITVKIRAPKAEGFDRVVIIRDEDDGVPEHVRIIERDETSVTIELKPLAIHTSVVHRFNDVVGEPLGVA